jgi:hypothetical protein
MAKELEQFGKWLGKGRDPNEFEFEHLDPELVALVAKAGTGDDADPKVSTGPTLTSSSPYSRPSS